MILLDTHALLWWLIAPNKLSPRARAACEEIERSGGGVVSSISIWEIALKHRLGKLELPGPVSEMVARLEQDRLVHLRAVDAATWLQTAQLEWDHRDPADRVIVATAMLAGVPILTKDEAMHTQKLVECVW